MVSIIYNKPSVTIYGNEFEFQKTEELDETYIYLFLNSGQVYILEANDTEINGVLQTSVEMIADTFNA
jgi:hypothetical protein